MGERKMAELLSIEADLISGAKVEPGTERHKARHRHDPEYQDRVIDRDDPDAPEVRVLGRAVAYASPDGWRA